MNAALKKSAAVAHRLGDEWLMAYAAGALSEGQSLLVASHLSFIDDALRGSPLPKPWAAR